MVTGGPELDLFRAETRAWLEDNYPAALRAKQESGEPLGRDDYLSWHKVLAQKGWVAP